MALILAVNPGSTQSATLARVARQLHGHELIGADSCAVAMKAIEQRMPALVLLPSTATKGERELLQRLQSAPGGVPSLRLPSPTSVDPRALADEIRELLGERPVGPILEVDLDPYNTSRTSRPSQSSAHLVAAATAAIDWIRARRATWSAAPVGTPAPAEALPVELEPVFEYAARTRPTKTPKSVEAWAPPPPPRREPAWAPPPSEAWAPPARKSERSGTSRASATASQSREMIAAWLPRVAALAVVLGVVWIGIGYWPRLLAIWNSTVTKMQTTSAPSAPTETRPIAGAKPPARGGRASTGTAVPPGQLGMSGWVAVFSSVEITVSEGNKAIVLDDRSQAMLPAGRHRLRFQNRTLGYDETRTVQIRPTETTTLTLTPQTTVGVTSNEPAEVLIDGTLVGGTPLKGYRINLGTHTVVVRAAGGERQINIDATSKPIQLEIDFSRP
jgi:PEGA domain-containing protein